MKILIILGGFSLLGLRCASDLTVPPPNTAYLRDPNFLIDMPDWKDPRHVMIVNNSHYYVTVRMNGVQIKFEEYVRKRFPVTFYLAPGRVANMLLTSKGGPTRAGFSYVTSLNTVLHLEFRAFLAPDFENPVAVAEQTIEINWRRDRQEVELRNSHFTPL